MRRKGRERRLRFFDRGNTRCPICLEPFSREAVRKGQRATLEQRGWTVSVLPKLVRR